MVEYQLQLDSVFGSLADPTRRDILKRVANQSLSVGEIAANYNMSFAAISKHLKILERANMITKFKKGKQRYVQLSPTSFQDAAEYLGNYQNIWNQRFDNLEKYLKEDK